MPRALEQVRRPSEIKYDLGQSLDIHQAQRSRTPSGRAAAIILVPVGCDGWNADASYVPVEGSHHVLFPPLAHGSTADGRTGTLGLRDVQRLAKVILDLAESSDLLSRPWHR